MNFSVYRNGRKVPDKLYLDHLLFEEIGVFESLRTYQGCFFRAEEHLLRLKESARTAGARLPSDRKLKSELRKALDRFRKENQTAEKGGRETDFFIRLCAVSGDVYVMVGERRHPEKIYRDGVVLKTTCIRRSAVNSAAPQTKTNAYQNAVLAALQPTPGAYESLFLDQHGFVAEVSIGNIFLVKNNVLQTPPAARILNGVTRRFVIECALRDKIDVQEVPLTRHDVYNADEAFLTNTSWEILPVRELDGRKIGRHIPGPQTLKIHKIFKKRVQRECRISKSAAHL